MKKFFKLIIIFLILIVLILTINTVRNIYIINSIKKISNQYFSDMKSYKGKIESYSSYTSTENNTEVLTNVIDVKEFFYKYNIYLVKNYRNDQLEDIQWKNADTNETASNNPTNNNLEDKFIYTDIMKIDFLIKEDFSNNKIKLYLLNFIKTDNKNYIIDGKEAQFYYNKENGILSKFYIDDSRYEIYSIEKNTVTDNDLIKPDNL